MMEILSVIAGAAWFVIGLGLWVHEGWDGEDAIWWPLWALKSAARGLWRALVKGWFA